jgi:hypothetical protein
MLVERLSRRASYTIYQHHSHRHIRTKQLASAKVVGVGFETLEAMLLLAHPSKNLLPIPWMQAYIAYLLSVHSLEDRLCLAQIALLVTVAVTLRRR